MRLTTSQVLRLRAVFCRADSCSGYPIKEFDVVPKESSAVFSYMAIRKYDEKTGKKYPPIRLQKEMTLCYPLQEKMIFRR